MGFKTFIKTYSSDNKNIFHIFYSNVSTPTWHYFSWEKPQSAILLIESLIRYDKRETLYFNNLKF